MISYPTPVKAVGEKVVRRTPSLRQLEDLYQKLTVCLDVLNEQLIHVEESSARSCLIVLEDDLNALLIEVEDSMLSEVEPKCFKSLRTRTETVITELKDILRG